MKHLLEHETIKCRDVVVHVKQNTSVLWLVHLTFKKLLYSPELF